MILAGDLLRDGPEYLRDEKAARRLFEEASHSNIRSAEMLGRNRLNQVRGPSIADKIRGSKEPSNEHHVSTEAILFGTGMALMILGAQSNSSASNYSPNAAYDHYSSTVHTWSMIGMGEVGQP